MKYFIILLLLFTGPAYGKSMYAQIGKVSSKDERCMALNIYFEARNQSIAGQLAVAFVTMNRVISDKYPTTICAVVYQNKYTGQKYGCQFSWTCDARSDRPRNKFAWQQIEILTKTILYIRYYVWDVTLGATHYHTRTIKPVWAKKEYRTVAIGEHIFYRLK